MRKKKLKHVRALHSCFQFFVALNFHVETSGMKITFSRGLEWQADTLVNYLYATYSKSKTSGVLEQGILKYQT